MKNIRDILILLVVGFLLYHLLYTNTQQKQKSVVTNVIDGDTIVIQGGDRVRLLGIDAPEKNETFYKESKARLEQLIENKEVMLEREGDNKDRYSRLLRYVFLNDTNINLLLVQEGYAICYFYDKSKYQSQCRALEEEARNDKIGRWQES